jgi:hypothetical protein
VRGPVVLVIFLLVLFNGFLTFFAQLFIRSRAVVVEEEAADVVAGLR